MDKGKGGKGHGAPALGPTRGLISRVLHECYLTRALNKC